VAHFSGGAFPTLGLPIGGDLGWLRKTTTSFWEDVQFKDFERAASYHTMDRQDLVDIPFLIERIFGVKPEALDIMEYEIVMAEIDSTGLRARVKTRLKVKLLVLERVKSREIMLFYHRKTVDSPWYMELETSLRGLDAEVEKKH
jgi:hypothetical protein